MKTSDKQKINYYFRDAQGNVLSIYRKSVILPRNETYFFCEEQTLYGSARLGTEQVEHSMRGLVTNDGLTDEITRAREQHGDDWQSHLQQQYDGRFYERLQEAWGNEWSTRLDLVLQGNNDTWLIEQIRNESYTLQVGNKRYELANHLGNVLAVVSDKKEQSDGGTWSAIVVSAQDYFPFGMAMPGRSTDAKHRYGFNGKETDPETGLNDFGARMMDSRLGRWLSMDALWFKYPYFSPYVANGNNPILFKDTDGRDIIVVIDGKMHTLTNSESLKTLKDSKIKQALEAMVTTEVGKALFDKISGDNTIAAYMTEGLDPENQNKEKENKRMALTKQLKQTTSTLPEGLKAKNVNKSINADIEGKKSVYSIEMYTEDLLQTQVDAGEVAYHELFIHVLIGENYWIESEDAYDAIRTNTKQDDIQTVTHILGGLGPNGSVKDFNHKGSIEFFRKEVSKLIDEDKVKIMRPDSKTWELLTKKEKEDLKNKIEKFGMHKWDGQRSEGQGQLQVKEEKKD